MALNFLNYPYLYTGAEIAVGDVDNVNEGWLHIYVNKAGCLNDDNARRNLFFVNQQGGIFS